MPNLCIANGVEGAADTQAAAPAECTGTNYRDPASLNYIVCSPIYGRPKKKDCIAASQDMGERIGHLTEDREFIGRGAVPAYGNHTQELTPQFFASKKCNISVDTRHAHLNRDPRSDLEKGSYLWGRADAILKKCVEPLGIGGWAVAGEQSADLGVYVFHPSSRFATLTNHRHSCTPDDEDELLHAECHHVRQHRSSSAAPSPASTPKTPSTPRAQQCGAPCLSHSDCSVESNCLCTSTTFSFPVSSTWGTFRCTFVPNAVALLAAAVPTESPCRGRCLLDANGTLRIQSQESNGDQSPNLMEGALTCPCNCTYVSQRCCLSKTGTVREDPAMRVQTSLLLEDGNPCGDE